MSVGAAKYFILLVVFIFIEITVFAQIVNGSLCLVGEPNPALNKELANYGDVINISLEDLDSGNCNIIFFTYFNEIPEEAMMIYDYTEKNYVFWIGKPPPISCINQKVAVHNISGVVRLNEYCKIDEKFTNLQVEIIKPLWISQIGTLKSKNENIEYPAILQSNGQKLVYFTYNVGETPSILECLIESVEKGEVDRMMGKLAQEGIPTERDMIQNDSGSYSIETKSMEEVMALACLLILIFVGSYLIWKN